MLVNLTFFSFNEFLFFALPFLKCLNLYNRLICIVIKIGDCGTSIQKIKHKELKVQCEDSKFNFHTTKEDERNLMST